MIETIKKASDRRALVCYLVLFPAFALAAGFAAWKYAPSGVPGDPFGAVTSPWELTLAAAKLFFPILCEFLAVFVFAFSPFTVFVSLCAVCRRAVRIGMMLRPTGEAGPEYIAAVCFCTAAAVSLVSFCAVSAVLSPRLRTVRFSSFDGRREALCLSVCFFTLSGAASLLMTGAGAILHFA